MYFWQYDELAHTDIPLPASMVVSTASGYRKLIPTGASDRKVYGVIEGDTGDVKGYRYDAVFYPDSEGFPLIEFVLDQMGQELVSMSIVCFPDPRGSLVIGRVVEIQSSGHLVVSPLRKNGEPVIGGSAQKVDPRKTLRLPISPEIMEDISK